MTEAQEVFSVCDAMAAPSEVRRTLWLGAMTFPLQDFIGKLSDEIERGSGRTDADDAAVIHVTGPKISPDDIARFYASAEACGHGPDPST